MRTSCRDLQTLLASLTDAVVKAMSGAVGEKLMQLLLRPADDVLEEEEGLEEMKGLNSALL